MNEPEFEDKGPKKKSSKFAVRLDDVMAVGLSEEEKKAVADKPADDDIVLTDEQHQLLLTEYRNGTVQLRDLTNKIFGGSYDGRSKQGMAVKRALTKIGINPKRSFEYIKKTDRILTDAQKNFILENHQTKNAVEIARELFTNENLEFNSTEAVAVIEYIKQLPNNYLTGDTSDYVGGYKSPGTEGRMIQKLKKAIPNYYIDEKKITQKQKSEIKAIMGFLRTNRFIQTINTYEDSEDKTMFEERFIHYTHDKPDLPPEEVDAYINYAVELVSMKHNMKQITRLRKMLEEVTEDPEAKITIALVEGINAMQKEQNDNFKRQDNLRTTLVGKRSDRMKSKNMQSQTVLNLVEAWKNEDNRKEMLDYAQREKALIGKEIDRFIDLDGIRGMLMGITKEEILNSEL